jgi:Family of unknown function (DUF5685)
MGRIYGHRSRVLLNHDTVFLAELISILSGERSEQSDWREFQSYNCLHLPQDVTRIPFCLEYAATATLILANFKLLDQCTDSRSRLWPWLHAVGSPSFHSAFARLSGWGFPVEELKDIMASQDSRETRQWQRSDSPIDRMMYFAEPTAVATGLFLRHGALLRAQSVAAGDDLYVVGLLFGRLAYLLDALTDFESDAKGNTFNAVRAALGLSGRTLGPDAREWVVQYARRIEDELEAGLRRLQLPSAVRSDFLNRLRFALRRQTGVCLPIIQSTAACSTTDSLFRQYVMAVLAPWHPAYRAKFLTAWRDQRTKGKQKSG